MDIIKTGARQYLFNRVSGDYHIEVKVVATPDTSNSSLKVQVTGIRAYCKYGYDFGTTCEVELSSGVNKTGIKTAYITRSNSNSYVGYSPKSGWQPITGCTLNLKYNANGTPPEVYLSAKGYNKNVLWLNNGIYTPVSSTINEYITSSLPKVNISLPNFTLTKVGETLTNIQFTGVKIGDYDIDRWYYKGANKEEEVSGGNTFTKTLNVTPGQYNIYVKARGKKSQKWSELKTLSFDTRTPAITNFSLIATSSDKANLKFDSSHSGYYTLTCGDTTLVSQTKMGEVVNATVPIINNSNSEYVLTVYRENKSLYSSEAIFCDSRMPEVSDVSIVVVNTNNTSSQTTAEIKFNSKYSDTFKLGDNAVDSCVKDSITTTTQFIPYNKKGYISLTVFAKNRNLKKTVEVPFDSELPIIQNFSITAESHNKLGINGSCKFDAELIITGEGIDTQQSTSVVADTNIHYVVGLTTEDKVSVYTVKSSRLDNKAIYFEYQYVVDYRRAYISDFSSRVTESVDTEYSVTQLTFTPNLDCGVVIVDANKIPNVNYENITNCTGEFKVYYPKDVVGADYFYPKYEKDNCTENVPNVIKFNTEFNTLKYYCAIITRNKNRNLVTYKYFKIDSRLPSKNANVSLEIDGAKIDRNPNYKGVAEFTNKIDSINYGKLSYNSLFDKKSNQLKNAFDSDTFISDIKFYTNGLASQVKTGILPSATENISVMLKDSFDDDYSLVIYRNDNPKLYRAYRVKCNSMHPEFQIKSIESVGASLIITYNTPKVKDDFYYTGNWKITLYDKDTDNEYKVATGIDGGSLIKEFAPCANNKNNHIVIDNVFPEHDYVLQICATNNFNSTKQYYYADSHTFGCAYLFTKGNEKQLATVWVNISDDYDSPNWKQATPYINISSDSETPNWVIANNK